MGYSKTLEMGDAFEVGGSLTWASTIMTVSSNIDLGTIVLPHLSSSIKSVFIDLKYASLINTSALVNYIENATFIVVDYHGTQTNALSIPAGSLWCYPGDVNRHLPGSRIYGNTDVHAEFSSAATVHLGFINAVAHHDSLLPVGIQPIARVILE